MYRGFWKNLTKPIIGLSPMDGVSDAPYRYITAKHGHPTIHITEFTNVDALHHGAVKALAAFIYSPKERPVIAQIYGTNPENFYKSCIIACELGFDGIDINMGCPSKSVSGNGAGAGLIRTPELAQEIIKACQQATQDWADGKTMIQAKLHPKIINFIVSAQTGKWGSYFDQDNNPTEFFLQNPFTPPRHLLPISVKTRIGYDQPITEEWLKYIIELKPANISLHGRTLKQMYTGQANWEEIAKAATLVHREIPETTFLGNGDIKSYDDALEKIQTYGVDGVLIGRASFGNPWIFKPQAPDPTPTEKLAMALEHARKNAEIFGHDPKVFSPMKKHLGWYCTGFPNAKELRQKMMSCTSVAELEQVISSAEI